MSNNTNGLSGLTDLLNTLQAVQQIGSLLGGNGSVSNTPASKSTPAARQSKRQENWAASVERGEVIDGAGSLKIVMTEAEAIAFAEAFTERSTVTVGKKTFRFYQAEGQVPVVQIYKTY